LSAELFSSTPQLAGRQSSALRQRGTLAPGHTGAQPATYEIEGKTVRPLGDETDKAFALLSSLNEAQRKQGWR
jgi:hypothetical protein